MSVAKICECCKKEFRVPQRRNETVRFCSLACKTEGRRKKVQCAVCKTMFSCKASETLKYCSRTCFHAANKGSKHATDPEVVRYHKVCEVCKVGFDVNATRKDTARFCSKKCMTESPELRVEMSSAMQGEKHWRWAGGLYQHKSGYTRYKKKVGSTEKFVLSHRVIVLKAMLELMETHPFIVVVDGSKKLSPDIEVHHIDRKRSNNALSNLLAVTKLAHARIHHKGVKPKPWECWPSDPPVW